MYHNVRRVVFVAALFMLVRGGFAQYGPHLNDGVGKATAIVVGRLDQCIAEPESIDRLVYEELRTQNGIRGNAAAVVLGSFQPRGTYVFTVTGTVLGKVPQPLVVRLPRVSDPDRTRSRFEKKEGLPLKATYLLILSGTAEAGFAPTTWGPIPLGGAVKMPEKPVDGAAAALPAVVALLADSLADPAVRKFGAYMLSDCVDAEALKVMAALAEDEDNAVRAAAIECMAANQDVRAIPLIGAWQYNFVVVGREVTHLSGNPLGGALGYYTKPDAIPALNRLLKNSNQYVRQNAANALRNLPPDPSSIPNLVWLLRDTPSTQARQEAYYLLCQFSPPPAEVRRVFFDPVPESEIVRLERQYGGQPGPVR